MSSSSTEGSCAPRRKDSALESRLEFNRSVERPSPRDERALLVSLSEIGQQLPVVVIEEAPSFILIDGYKRVRALKRLAREAFRHARGGLSANDVVLRLARPPGTQMDTQARRSWRSDIEQLLARLPR